MGSGEWILGQIWVQKFFLLFSDVLGSFLYVFPENGSFLVFTFERIPVCLVFFRVSALSLIGNRMFYTGLGSGIWTRFGSEILFLGRKKSLFCFFGYFGQFLLCFSRKWIVVGFYLREKLGLSCVFSRFRTVLKREYSVLYWLRQWILDLI